MRWLAALLLAACAAPDPGAQCTAEGELVLAPPEAQETVAAPVPPAAKPPAHARWQPAPAVAMPAPAVQPAAATAIVGPPSQAMRALAVVPDGTAAVSADVAGSVRLWPTLDGTVEPVAVAMRRPVALAITRAGTDLVIAGVDGAGQLEIVDVGPFGEPRWRKPVEELSRPVTDVRATETGFLVETDDQHLGFVDFAARLQGEVEPPDGTDIAAIAVNRERMLALLSGGGTVRGRWLVFSGSLQWGEETSALPLAPRAVTLSPDSTMLAGILGDNLSTRLVVVGIEHADLRAVAIDDNAVDPTLRPVRFLDSTTVLTATSQDISLWRVTGGTLGVTSSLLPGPAATDGGSTAVIGDGSELVLADAAGLPRYLGFRMPTFTALAPAAHSLLATDGQRVIRIGDDLREYASYDLGGLYAPVSPGVSALLDHSHVLVQFYNTATRLDVVSLDTLDTSPIDETQWLAYDPGTRLAAFLQDDVVRFRRFDPADGAFGPAAELKTESRNSSVVFSDGGAIVTTYLETGFVTRTVTKIRPERGSLSATRSHVKKFTDAVVPVFGPAPAPYARTVKSPDRSLSASIGYGRISLRDADGNVRWTVPANGAYDLTWLASGKLLATGAGIARVDVDTGAFAERRCGWEFGLWSQRNNVLAPASICDAE